MESIIIQKRGEHKSTGNMNGYIPLTVYQTYFINIITSTVDIM